MAYKFLSVRILGLAVGNVVVLLKNLLQVLRSAANLLGQLGTSDLLHETTSRVMSGVEIEDLGCLAVQDEPDGEFVLEHLAGDIVPVSEFITESVTLGIQEKTALATKS